MQSSRRTGESPNTPYRSPVVDVLDQLGTACVTEDTALCFEALGGLPGPYIKDFLGKLGHEGQSKHGANIKHRRQAIAYMEMRDAY